MKVWNMECQDCQAKVGVKDLSKITIKKGTSYHTTMSYACPECLGEWDLEDGVPREVWIEVENPDKIIDLKELQELMKKNTVGEN